MTLRAQGAGHGWSSACEADNAAGPGLQSVRRIASLTAATVLTHGNIGCPQAWAGQRRTLHPRAARCHLQALRTRGFDALGFTTSRAGIRAPGQCPAHAGCPQGSTHQSSPRQVADGSVSCRIWQLAQVGQRGVPPVPKSSDAKTVNALAPCRRASVGTPVVQVQAAHWSPGPRA